MATFSPQELNEIKKQQADAKEGLERHALKVELSNLRGKYQVMDKMLKETTDKLTEAQKTIMTFQQGMSLTQIREFAKGRAESFNINPAPISKYKDATTILNWLDAAIWRKTEAGEIKDGLAD